MSFFFYGINHISMVQQMLTPLFTIDPVRCQKNWVMIIRFITIIYFAVNVISTVGCRTCVSNNLMQINNDQIGIDTLFNYGNSKQIIAVRQKDSENGYDYYCQTGDIVPAILDNSIAFLPNPSDISSF